jgi:hypothetical protein
MGLFRAKNGVADAEKEIDGLKTRRKALLAQHQTATAALARAKEDRRTRLLESDLDAAGADREKVKGLVLRLADELDAVADALATVDGKLADAEGKLLAERERGKRDAERQRRQEQLDAARAARNEFKEVAARMVEALAPLTSVGVMSAAAHTNLAYLAGELDKGLTAAFDEVAQYISMVSAGTVEIKIEPPVPHAPPSAPAIERMPIFLRAPSRWREADGEVVTAGPHCTVSPPVDVARAALQFNHAVEVDSETARALRAQMDPDYGWWAADRCCDLTQPAPAPGQPEVHVSEPARHSEFAPPAGPYAGAAMVGPARSTPVAR